MPEARVNGVRIHYEEEGEGAPILCVHGTGSSALMWGDAVPRLAVLGRVIAYDRRGSTRSERPDPYERTTLAEHADDAAALLDAVGGGPAVVVGRSYGGSVAVDLAIRRPSLVVALALLEPGLLELTPETAGWSRAALERLEEVAEREGVGAVAEAMFDEMLGEGVWPSFPEDIRAMFTANAPAILAESREEAQRTGAPDLGAVRQPVLLVGAADSPPVFRAINEAMAHALPDVRSVRVAGGHIIDPAGPEVLEFIEEVLAGPWR